MKKMYPKGYGIVFKKYLENPNLSTGAKSVYALIASYTGDNDFAWPSHTTLAKCLSVTKRCVINWLDELEGAGIVVIRREHGEVNKYYLVMPSDDQCIPVHYPVNVGSLPSEPGFTQKINNTNNNKINTSAASAAIVKTDPLYHKVEEAFKSKNDGVFSDYPKEGVCIHALVKKAKARSPEDPSALLAAMLNAFWKLKTTDTSAKGFWRGQPFLPSALSPLWDRVLETMRNDEVDPELLAIVNGGAA